MIGLACGVALSLHVNLMDRDYNSVHPYCQYESEKNYIVGAYYNSVYRPSYFVGYKWHLNDDTSIDYVLVHGYKQYPILPIIKLNYKYTFVMPAVDNDQVGIVVGLDFQF